MTIGTFNMRMSTPIDGENAFPYRKAAVFQKIREEKPAVLGLQEITDEMLADLIEALPEYAFVGSGREKDFSGEHCTIAFLKEEVELHALDTFWLSPTPYEPGSRYVEQSDCPRICTFGRFYYRKSKTLFHFFNTHLDHLEQSARQEGLKQICHVLIKEKSKWPVPFVLVGDFNFTPQDPEYQTLHTLPFPYISLTENLPYTYHGYGNTKTYTTIDYMITDFVKAPVPLTLWEKENRYLSDHLAICAKLF